MPMTDAPNFVPRFGWRKPQRTGLLRSPCRGRAPPRPAGEGVVSRRFPLVPERLPHRVGADLCVRPWAGPVKDRGRDDTRVGPYGSTGDLIDPGKPGGGEAPPLRMIGCPSASEAWTSRDSRDRPARGRGPFLRRFPLVPERLPHRVGADLCVRPSTPLCGNRSRDDTSVGP